MVSIIIPTYNAEKTIKGTLDSVYAQTYKNFEVIVVNDGSTDHTSAVLENFTNSITILSTENKGVSHARNLGLKYSKGDYIQYLDADDLLMPEKIEMQLQALKAENADVAYGDWQKFKIENNQIKISETVEREIQGDLEVALFTYFWCPPAAILYSRRICDILKWNEHLPIIQDARYFLDAAIAKGKFIYTNGIMARYRIAQSDSLSQESDLNFVKDLYKNTKGIYTAWKTDLNPNKKTAIIQSLRHCINRLSVLEKSLMKEAIEFLLQIEPHYLPPEKGLLRTMSKIIGYKNAEKLAGFKRALEL
ncbi:hypothetical protein ASG14_11900 [Pedobacter sp. Leaf194]|nr:hypothetical protein ASG14_11900 [Pedobacter sp. Leaf194]